jgi:membrane protease YdiL (CAAX protease family)
VEIHSRAEFLNLAGLVEGGTVVAALLLAWLLGVSPWELLHWRWDALAIGVLATLPMFSLFFIATGPREVATEMLGAALDSCHWYDLVLLAALAGVGEELLFRGVLQPWLAGWNPTFAFFAANIVFGLIHAVTPTYALLATGVGMYLSWLTFGVGEPNLWRAIIAHGVYDAMAFAFIVREYRKKQRQRAAGEEEISEAE